jgi:hypothetical protein
MLFRQIFYINVRQAGKTAKDKHVPKPFQTLGFKFLSHQDFDFFLCKITPVHRVNRYRVFGKGIPVNPLVFQGNNDYVLEKLHVFGRRVFGAAPFSQQKVFKAGNKPVIDVLQGYIRQVVFFP